MSLHGVTRCSCFRNGKCAQCKLERHAQDTANDIQNLREIARASMAIATLEGRVAGIKEAIEYLAASDMHTSAHFLSYLLLDAEKDVTKAKTVE